MLSLDLVKTELDIEQIKLYDCEINMETLSFVPFQRLSLSNNNYPKDWIIEEVSVLKEK